jgi:hypothetical protein
MLTRIRAELVQHQGEVKRHLRFQADRGSPGRDPGLVDRTLQQLVIDQVAQASAFPGRRCQEGVYARQRLDASGGGKSAAAPR